MESLKEAADELAYRNAPVEARLALATLIALKMAFPSDMSRISTYSGLRLVVDPEIEPRTIEFRAADGTVTATVKI